MNAIFYKVSVPLFVGYHVGLYIPKYNKFIHNSGNLKNKYGGSIVSEDVESFLKNREIFETKKCVISESDLIKIMNDRKNQKWSVAYNCEDFCNEVINSYMGSNIRNFVFYDFKKYFTRKTYALSWQ